MMIFFSTTITFCSDDSVERGITFHSYQPHSFVSWSRKASENELWIDSTAALANSAGPFQTGWCLHNLNFKINQQEIQCYF